MKKIIILVSIILLSVILLSGCGEDEEGKGCLTGILSDFPGT